MAASSSVMPVGSGMDMVYSGAIAAALAYGSYSLVSKPVGDILGLSEYPEVFLGMGVTSVLAPAIVAAFKSQSAPQLPSMGKATAMDFVYGGAIGTAAYWAWNMAMPGYSPAVDVAVAALISGAVAPYLSFLKPQY